NDGDCNRTSIPVNANRPSSRAGLSSPLPFIDSARASSAACGSWSRQTSFPPRDEPASCLSRSLSAFAGPQSTRLSHFNGTPQPTKVCRDADPDQAGKKPHPSRPVPSTGGAHNRSSEVKQQHSQIGRGDATHAPRLTNVRGPNLGQLLPR